MESQMNTAVGESQVHQSFDQTEEKIILDYEIDTEDELRQYDQATENEEDTNVILSDDSFVFVDATIKDKNETVDYDIVEVMLNENSSSSDTIEDVRSETNISSEHENQVIGKFYSRDALPCCLLQCNKRIPKDLVLATRQSVQNMTKSEQDLIIFAHLQAHRRVPCLKEEYGKKTARGHSRLTTTDDNSYRRSIRYVYCDIEICRVFYLFIYDVGEKRYGNLVEYFSKHGLRDRQHKNKGRVSTNKTAMTLEEREEIKQFIRIYAQKHAIPLLGRMFDEKKFCTVKLPATISKKKVYDKFVETIMKENEVDDEDSNDTSKKTQKRIFSYKSFLRVWNDLFLQKKTEDQGRQL